MNTRRFLIAGMAGGIVYFLLGWVIHEVLLSSFMQSTVAGVRRSEIFYEALVLGNFSMGFALSYAMNRSRRVSVQAGIKMGIVMGLLFALGFDSILYATTNLVTPAQVCADVVSFTLLSAIAGAAVGRVCESDRFATA